MGLRLSPLLLAAFIFSCDGAREGSDGDVTLAEGGRDFASAVASDTTLAAAERALNEGHAWRATRLLAPVLQDSARRTPAAVLLAARAAAGWEGWSEVERRGQPKQ